MARRLVIAAVALLPLLAIVACRNAHVDLTIENRTGAEVRLLEVDYPRASFGVDVLASGAVFHYRIQVVGEGEVKVQYADPSHHLVQIKGIQLAEGDQGRLEIVLLPGGKADFHPHLVQNR